MTSALDPFLVTEELLDCNGRVTHRLVLDLDGTVLVTICGGSTTIRVDPKRRLVLTPGAHLPAALLDAACGMRLS